MLAHVYSERMNAAQTQDEWDALLDEALHQCFAADLSGSPYGGGVWLLFNDRSDCFIRRFTVDKLVQDFVEAIGKVSYYNAAEGDSWYNERAAARQANEQLQELKKEMLATYGREFTAKVISETPNLCFMELSLGKE